ncbi:MAG: hypothetical protein ACI9UO_002086 [Nitrospinales bacterium]
MNNLLKKSIQVLPQRVGPVCFFFVLAALYLGDIQKLIFVERDLLHFFIPPRQFWVEEVKNFTFPLWNPYYFNGHPLFATLQPGVLYPFSILYLLIPFHWAFNLNIVIHFALSGWFTYLLVRGMKASHGASLISGITFMLSGYLISVMGMLSTLISVTWVPLFFLTFFAAIKKNNLGYAVLSGFVGTCMFLGGGVEVCYLTFGVTFFLVLFPKYLSEKEDFPNFKRRLFLFALFCLIFFGLSAVQLIPFIELSQLSIRSSGLTYEQASLWSLHPWDLLEFFVPDQYGLDTNYNNYWKFQSWLKTIYMGAIPFLFSFFLLKSNKRIFFGFLFLFVVSMLLAIGQNTPLHHFLYDYLPFFNKLRYPVKFIFLAILILCITAGLGFDRFKQEANSQNNKVFFWGRVILVLGFLCILSFGIFNMFHTEFVSYFKSIGWDKPRYNEVDINLFNIKRLLAFTGLICACIFLYFKPMFRKPWLLVCIIVIIVLDLFFANHGYYNKKNVSEINQTEENARFLQDDPSIFRIYTTPKIRSNTIEMENLEWNHLKIKKEKFQIGMLGKTKIFESQGIGVTQLARWENSYTLIDSAPTLETTSLLNLMNVKYIVSKKELDSPSYKKVKESFPISKEQMKKSNLKEPYSIKVYENKNVFHRAFLVPNCKIINKEEDFKSSFLDRDFNFKTQMLLEKIPEDFSCTGEFLKTSEGSVKITSYKSNTVVLIANSKNRQLLFLADSFYPGWKVFVDGEEKEILRANYLFRAVVVESGEHKVRFEYDPLSFKIGMTITLLTFMVCLICLIKEAINRCSKTTQELFAKLINF